MQRARLAVSACISETCVILFSDFSCPRLSLKTAAMLLQEQATVAQTKPSSRLSRWLRQLRGSRPQPQQKPAELPTEVQPWLQEAAEPCAPRKACRGANEISKGRSEAQRWLDEAGFPPLPAAAARPGSRWRQNARPGKFARQRQSRCAARLTGGLERLVRGCRQSKDFLL